MKSLIIRPISVNEINWIGNIDRSETILGYYQLVDNTLQYLAANETVTGFDEAELNQIINRQTEILQSGGRVVGAFIDESLIGVASVENKKRGAKNNYAKMDILYVSKDFRQMKIGQQLLETCKMAAKNFEVNKLYISATPTKNTVDFYLKNGAKLATEIDQDLFALEPEDIHLEIVIP